MTRNGRRRSLDTDFWCDSGNTIVSAGYEYALCSIQQFRLFSSSALDSQRLYNA